MEGLTLLMVADGDQLRIRGPRQAEPIAQLLLTHKPVVLAALTATRSSNQQADSELLLARQLAKNWSDTRADLERLVLSAAERKGWPHIQLGQGAWLLPGKQAWQRYAGNPCTKPDGLVRALEVLHGHPGAG
jgi:hypothetical protein